MGTKSSLKHERDEATGQGVHLYREVSDDGHVYLEVDGFPFEAASSVDLSGEGAMHLTIRFPKEWARKLGLLQASDVAWSAVNEPQKKPGRVKRVKRGRH